MGRCRAGRRGRGAPARRKEDPEEEGRGTALRVHLSPMVLRVESPVRRLTRAVRGGPVVRDHSITAGPGTPEPFGLPPRREVSASTVRLAALGHVPWEVPEDPLQCLRRQPASEPPARVLLGTLDERPAQAIVQAFATLLISRSRPRLQVVHAVQSSGPRTPGARPFRGERSAQCGAGGRGEGSGAGLSPAYLTSLQERGQGLQGGDLGRPCRRDRLPDRLPSTRAEVDGGDVPRRGFTV